MPEVLCVGDHIAISLHNFTSNATNFNSIVENFIVSWDFESFNGISLGVASLRVVHNITSLRYSLNLFNSFDLRLPAGGITSRSVSVSALTTENGNLTNVEVPFIDHICGFQSLTVEYLNKRPGSISSVKIAWDIPHFLSPGDEVHLILPGEQVFSSKNLSREECDGTPCDGVAISLLSNKIKFRVTAKQPLLLEGFEIVILATAGVIVPVDGISPRVSLVQGFIDSSSCNII